MYLLGLVGGGKFSLVEWLKYLIEKIFFYVIKGLLVNELLFNLFVSEEDCVIFEEEYGILRCYVKGIMFFWVVKCLYEFNGDIFKFKVVKLYFFIFD